MPELIALPYSPWSEKARWALDHHRIQYREIEHQILLGEPWLRWKVRRPFGKVTVPALVDGSRVYRDSFEIARYSDWFGKGDPLIGDHFEAIREWNAVSERALAAGRVLVTERSMEDPQAKEEYLPAFLPQPTRPLLRPLVSVGVAYIRRKHDFDHIARAEVHLEHALQQLRAALADRQTILTALSYADIAMATVLQFVQPVDQSYISLGAATRRCFTQEELAQEFRDLIEWRDGLYDRFRRG